MLARLSHLEWWLLDLVDEWGVAIHDTAHGNYGVNKRYYKYSPEDLFEAFCRLTAEGWIQGGFHSVKEPLTPEKIRFELYRPAIIYEAGAYVPVDPPELYYCLTE